MVDRYVSLVGEQFVIKQVWHNNKGQSHKTIVIYGIYIPNASKTVLEVVGFFEITKLIGIIFKC